MLTAPDSKSRPRSRFASRQAAPVPALAGAVGRVSALADDALVTPLLGYGPEAPGRLRTVRSERAPLSLAAHAEGAKCRPEDADANSSATPDGASAARFRVLQ